MRNRKMDMVSVIITTHDRLKLLKKAVESVLNQTYKNIELIVVDDCSEDGTSDWMKKIISNNVRYYYISKEESCGGNHARNIGIEMATGEFIAFLDDDDIWYPEKIEKQMNVMLSSPSIGLVYCGRTFIYDNDFRYQLIPKPEWKGDLSEKVFYSIFCTTSMILIKKSVLKKAGYFDEKLNFWQEYDLLIRVCQLTQINFVGEVLVDILAVSSDSARLTNKLEGWGRAVAYIEEKYKPYINSLPDQYKKRHYKMIYNDAANRCFTIGNSKKQRKYLEKAFLSDPHITGLIKFLFNISNIQFHKVDQIRHDLKMKILRKS